MYVIYGHWLVLIYIVYPFTGQIISESEDESGDEDEEGNEDDEEAYMQEQQQKLEQQKDAILSNQTMLQEVGTTHSWSCCD